VTPLPLVQFNNANQRIKQWTPTTFAALEGKIERDLEGMIACDLATLGIEELARTDRKYQVLRQCQLPRQMASTIKPDILVIREDGELFVIEVKVGTNAELFDRKAIGQVIEYASAISQLSEAELANMLDLENKGLNLGELFDHWFMTPKYTTPYRVQNARKLVNNIVSGNINLFIVSDVLPSGAYNWIDGWSTQSHVPFNFSAIEVTPFVNDHDASLLLVPQTKIETAIISRTVVEVKQVGEQVAVKILPTSVDQIEQNQKKTHKRQNQPTILGEMLNSISQNAISLLNERSERTYKSSHIIHKRDDFEQIVFDGKDCYLVALRIYLRGEYPIGWLAWVESSTERIDYHDQVPAIFESFMISTGNKYQVSFDTGPNISCRGMGVSSLPPNNLISSAKILTSHFKEDICDTPALRDELSKIYAMLIEAMIKVIESK